VSLKGHICDVYKVQANDVDISVKANNIKILLIEGGEMPRVLINSPIHDLPLLIKRRSEQNYNSVTPQVVTPLKINRDLELIRKRQFIATLSLKLLKLD
jgi:hypothetical protein